MGEESQQVEPQKRISFDLRGENAETFEAFRLSLASKLGFNISPSKAVLWVIHRLKTLEGAVEGEE